MAEDIPGPTRDLPAPPAGMSGWPWSVEDAPAPAAHLATDAGWPSITIVIPSFNQGEHIERCLRSIILQGYPDLELMVFDAGSGDRTMEVVRAYSRCIDHAVSRPDRANPMR